MTVLTEKNSSKSQENPWVELLKEIWANKVLVLVTMFLSMVVGVFTAMWMRPVYEANALMQVKVKGGSLTAMLGDVGALLGMGGGSAETETQLMQSRRILEEVIDSLGLRYNATPTSVIDRILHREGRVDVNTSICRIPPCFRRSAWECPGRLSRTIPRIFPSMTIWGRRSFPVFPAKWLLRHTVWIPSRFSFP